MTPPIDSDAHQGPHCSRATAGSARVQLMAALRACERDQSDLVSVPLSMAEIKALLLLAAGPQKTRPAREFLDDLRKRKGET